MITVVVESPYAGNVDLHLTYLRAYIDLGISGGMRAGVEDAARRGCLVEYRELGAETVERLRGLVEHLR